MCSSLQEKRLVPALYSSQTNANYDYCISYVCLNLRTNERRVDDKPWDEDEDKDDGDTSHPFSSHWLLG